MVTHAHATGGGCPGEIQQLRAAHMHSAWAAQQTYSFPGRAVRTSAGRGRSVLQSGARTWARTYRRNTTGSRPFLRAHSSLVSVISLCPLEVARKRRIRVIRPTSMRSRDVRGRMRRPDASCAAAKTYALSKHVLPQESRKLCAGRWQRLRISVDVANIHVEEAGGSSLHSDIDILGCSPAEYSLDTPYAPTKRASAGRVGGCGR